MLADVVFPLRLAPLTYRVPQGAPENLEGRIVRAPLGRRSAFGVIVGAGAEAEQRKPLKEIESFHHHFACPARLSLLRWLSDYYLVPMGVALKSMFFQEVADCEAGATTAWSAPLQGRPDPAQETPRQESGAPATVLSALGKGKYTAFLYEARSACDEREFFFALLEPFRSGLRGAVIMVPELRQIELLVPALRDMFGERLAVLHSRLGKRRRRGNVCRLLEGASDVVVGTRSAVLGPLRNPSLIAVLGEHSPAYKAEEGLRYHGRDVAVMRGFLEKSCVVLSSFAPSLESAYNARAGKYALLRHGGAAARGPRRVVAGLKKTASQGLTLSPQVLANVRGVLNRKRRFLFLVHRKGYSYLKCGECQDLVTCPTCEVPVVFHQAPGFVRCRRCGYEQRAPQSCPTCRGTMLGPLGAGTERVKDELRTLLGAEAELVEKGLGARAPVAAGGGLESSLGGLVVGTPYAMRRPVGELFGGAVIVSLDQMLSRPDFRSHERAFQEVAEVAQMVDPGGRLFLQTWAPRSRIVRRIASGDYERLYEDELAQRRELGYPPLARLILIAVSVRGDAERFMREAGKLVKDAALEGVEILGPVPAAGIPQRLGTVYHVLLKCRDRRSLHIAAKRVASGLGKVRGTLAVVDVDPLEV